MSSKNSLIRNQLFMATSYSNVHGEVCVRHEASHKGCYSLATETKGVASIRRCTHQARIKNTLKGSDVPRGVLKSNYVRRIKIFIQGGMLPGVKISNHLRVRTYKYFF